MGRLLLMLWPDSLLCRALTALGNGETELVPLTRRPMSVVEALRLAGSDDWVESWDSDPTCVLVAGFFHTGGSTSDAAATLKQTWLSPEVANCPCHHATATATITTTANTSNITANSTYQPSTSPASVRCPPVNTAHRSDMT